MFSDDQIKAFLAVERRDREFQAKREAEIQARIEANRKAVENSRTAYSAAGGVAEYEDLKLNPSFGIF